MRRSRIKAMATLPARRRPTKDVKDENIEAQNPVANGKIDNNETTVITIPCDDDSKGTSLETVHFSTGKHETEVISSQPSSISRTVDIIEVNHNEEFATNSDTPESIIEERSDPDKEVLVKTTERLESVAAESSEQHIEIIGQDNAPCSDEAKASSSLDNAPVLKLSQTRTNFMRPTPRFDGGGRIRRNSVQGSGASASESEDDCRRTTNALTNRIRNDSVGSSQSPKGPIRENSGANVHANTTITAGNSVGGCTSLAKNVTSFNARQKRKMNVSESARKLAEARRQFLLKYEHKQPDRAKLTMYDLIYYNPVTNPIIRSDSSSTVAQRNATSLSTPAMENDEEEEEEEEDCETSEAMPVPQVKVGPDGHLVLDEQSLVIEHTGAKKNRQALARTEALVDDDSHGSGFYKKRQKTRDWAKWETLKFYKALNTVGTDFLLMQSLFPQRSRQEIKMKFKKEEKTNRRLVEKALTYHQEFDIESLKEDLATFEETESQQSELMKSEKSASRQGRGAKRKNNKSRRMAAMSIGELNELDERDEAMEKSTNDMEIQETAKGPGESGKVEKKRVGQRRSATTDAGTRSDDTSSSNESASDTEIYQIKPTRSGRKPKVRKLQAPTINTLDNLFSDHELQVFEESESSELAAGSKVDESLTSSTRDYEEMTIDETARAPNQIITDRCEIIENSVSNIAQVEPGSLVIVSRESTDEPGETVLQVYMVSSDVDDNTGTGKKQNMTPVILTPELLNTVTAGITKVAPINVNND